MNNVALVDDTTQIYVKAKFGTVRITIYHGGITYRNILGVTQAHGHITVSGVGKLGRRRLVLVMAPIEIRDWRAWPRDVHYTEGYADRTAGEWLNWKGEAIRQMREAYFTVMTSQVLADARRHALTVCMPRLADEIAEAADQLDRMRATLQAWKEELP